VAFVVEEVPLRAAEVSLLLAVELDPNNGASVGAGTSVVVVVVGSGAATSKPA
jgi:hypothetical protein